MTNEGQREKNIWPYIIPNESSDMIGKGSRGIIKF
jgi:hypothetical protein